VVDIIRVTRGHRGWSVSAAQKLQDTVRERRKSRVFTSVEQGLWARLLDDIIIPSLTKDTAAQVMIHDWFGALSVTDKLAAADVLHKIGKATKLMHHCARRANARSGPLATKLLEYGALWCDNEELLCLGALPMRLAINDAIRCSLGECNPFPTGSPFTADSADLLRLCVVEAVHMIRENVGSRTKHSGMVSEW
jgi:hypothetical protein